MSCGGQGVAVTHWNSGRDMTGAVKRWPGIADPVAIATRTVARAVARAVTRAVARAVAGPIDYWGRLESGMTAGKHDGKSCGPGGPDAMHSGTVQKYLLFS
jgi:hypothetical protein